MKISPAFKFAAIAFGALVAHHTAEPIMRDIIGGQTDGYPNTVRSMVALEAPFSDGVQAHDLIGYGRMSFTTDLHKCLPDAAASAYMGQTNLASQRPCVRTLAILPDAKSDSYKLNLMPY